MKKFFILLIFPSVVFGQIKKVSFPTQNQLYRDIEYLSSDSLEGRESGTKGEAYAAEYIAMRMKELGLSPKGTNGYFQTFSFSPKINPHSNHEDLTKRISITNVIGFLNNGAKKTVVIGGHYDHLGHGIMGSLHAAKDSAIHNGADDNASGIALMLDLAKELKRKKFSKHSNYLFIAFSGEEMGLLGSNFFCKNPTIDLETLDYMLNFDMVGRLDESKGLAINGVGTSPNWKRELNKANKKSLKLVLSESGTGPSDHTSFYLKDIPVLHFFTGQHEDYHKPSDDIEKINFKGLQIISDFVFRLADQLKENEPMSFTKTKSINNKSPKFTVTLGVMPDYLFQGNGMRIDGVSEGKPASRAGFLKGDVVIQMDTLKIHNMQSYMKGLSLFEKGDSALVKVRRESTVIDKIVVF